MEQAKWFRDIKEVLELAKMNNEIGELINKS